MKRLMLTLAACFSFPVFLACAQEDISPASLSGKKSIELGDFVLSAMPVSGKALSWDWQSNSEIQWQDGVIRTNSGASLRSGFARINVMGVKSTVLEKRRNELGWEITLGTQMPAKFGPEYITMQPSRCGGYLNENCTFDPARSLVKNGVEFHKICSTIAGGPNTTDVYAIKAAGKESMLMTWQNSTGSSASSSWLELRMHSPDGASSYCNEIVREDFTSEEADKRSKKEIEHDTKAITTTLLKALDGLDGNHGDACSIKISANSYGGISALDASNKENNLIFCEKVIGRLSEIKLPLPSKDAPTTINLNVTAKQPTPGKK